jgi:HlyD family secretion protein
MAKTTAKKKWVRYTILGVLAVVVAVSIYMDATKPLTVQIATVTQGPIQAYVEERARTSLPHIYHITMPLPGRIMPIIVREGDIVTKDQLVATLEDVDWNDAATSAAEMIIAMKNAVEAAQSQLNASIARLEYTEWVREMNKKAMETSALSEKEVRQSEWQYLDASAKREESQTVFYAMDAVYSIFKLLPPSVDRILERTQVRSPVGGVILKRHVWNEKMMMPGQPLLDIGNLDDLEVTADVLTEQAVRIQPGDTVLIFGEAVGDSPIRGTVRRVKPEAFTKLSSLGVEQQRVPIEIAFNAEDLSALEQGGRTLGLHYRVRVQIITDEKEQALLIPRTALFRGAEGTWETFSIVDGRARRTPLTIGLMNDYHAQVLTGLEAGDEVVVAPESTLREGAKITSN